MVILLFASLHLSFKAHTHTHTRDDSVLEVWRNVCAKLCRVTAASLAFSVRSHTSHPRWLGGWIEECAEAGWNVSRLTIDLVQLEFFKYIVDKLVPTYIYCRAH